MSNKGKSAAIAQLRKEARFGCPKCRSPFLTWHHFDPPWHVEQHWRPEGMIALCPNCHFDADDKGQQAGAYSITELRRLKQAAQSAATVTGEFTAWSTKSSLLVRVGGNYSDQCTSLFRVNGDPLIQMGKDNDGRLTLSFELRDKDNSVILKMEDNWFHAFPDNIHDMFIPPKTKAVKVWLTKKDIGLEFSFKRITIDQLNSMLKFDRETANMREKERESQLPPEIQEFRRKQKHPARVDAEEWSNRFFRGEPLMNPMPLKPMLENQDNAGNGVREWVASNNVIEDCLIPLLNFERMSTYYHGERIEVRDGIGDLMHYNAGFGGGFTLINIPCPCAACTNARNGNAIESEPTSR